MAADPDARYQSVEVFRNEIVSYLRYRDVNALSDAALQCLENLERMLAEHDQASIDTGRAYRLAHEARFGFEQVRRAHPESELARMGA